MSIDAGFIVYPDWMPAPQQDSFSIQPEDRRLTSETEAGSIVRYQFDTDVNIAECTIILNRVQAAWFERFERDLLKHGTVWFNFPLWIGGELVWESCRFKTRPKAGSLIGLHTTYTFSLYVSKRTQLAFNDCLMQLFVCWPPCFFATAAGLFDSAFAKLAKTVRGMNASAHNIDNILRGFFFPLQPITTTAIADALGPDDLFYETFELLQNVTEQKIVDYTTINV